VQRPEALGSPSTGIGGGRLVGLAVDGEAGAALLVLIEQTRVLQHPPGGMLVAVRGVLDELHLGQLKALGLAPT
jgi:hypothetical protein